MSTNSELVSILDSVPIQDLLSTIQKKAKTGNKDIVSYIRAILQGSSDQSDASEYRRFETFKCAFSLLQIKDLPPSIISELLSLLILKVDLFQTSNLVKLCDVFINHAKKSDQFETKWMEIFCKVLSCLALRDTIVYQGKDMPGSELRKNIIASLFSDDSGTSCIIQLASALKDVELSEDEVSLVTERLIKILPSIEFLELPPFIYQLLLISSKGKCKVVLQKILLHFIEKDKQMQNLLYENTDSEDIIDSQEHIQYRQTEGTVILMISVICRHDQNVGKEFLVMLKKILHKPQLVFSPFTFSTALSLSKIHRNSDDIFDILKKSLMAAFQLKERRQNSYWFRNLIKWEEDVLKLVKETVICSKFGWDHVCQGLVRFGFIALDAFGPKNTIGNTVKTTCPDACNLGSHIIRDTFKCHRQVRQEIFEQILNRIITKSQKPVSHYIDMLSQIVQSDPLFLLDVLPKLVEILDYMHFLPHSNAEKVLQSLAPLLKISAPLKDTLMLVLRKALFHRDVEARKVAVCGYLTILKKINFIGKISLSQSQTSVSSRASSSSMISTQVKADVYVSAGNPTSKTMCLEIMGLLKRALMQQSEVRQLLYEGLYDVILQNQSLKDIVLELLLGQFEKYYNDNESEIPFHFNVCFQEQKGTLIIKEPLAHLITSIFLILAEGSNEQIDEDYDQSAQKMLENFTDKLLKRMLTADVIDFQIGKDADFEESSNESNIKTTLLLNIYESLIEYSFMQNPEFEQENCEEFLKLYHKYKQVINSVTKKKQSKTSKSKTNVTHSLFSHTTLNFIAKSMEALFLDDTFRHQEGLQLLRADSDFVIHAISACNQKFTKMCDSGYSDGFSQVMKHSFTQITTIGKALLKTYSDGLSSDFSSIEWNKLSGMIAEGLNIIFNFVSSHYQKSLNKFILNFNSDSCLSTSEALHSIIKSVQKSIMKLLSDTDDDNNLKECIPLLSVIKTLYVAFMADFKSDVCKWIKQLCSQQVFQNVAVSKAFISLCFTLGHQDENFLELLKDIAFDIHYHLGSIDPDESVTGTPKYDIITSDVARNILPIFFSNLEQCFEEIEWVLNFIKINSLGGNESVELSDVDCQFNIEKGICSRVSEIIFIFYELVQTGVAENIANTILKLVTRLYKILTALTKYYLQLHKNKSSNLHPSFEKLVKLSNTRLTTQVYAFITFIQMLSGETNNKKKKAKGNTGAFKAVQDVKTIPSLVFEIESYEKNLIILSKKYKKDLTNKMKLSTARDFRINAAVISTVLEQQENDSIADTTTDERSNISSQPNDPPQNTLGNTSPENDEMDDQMSVHDDSSDDAPNIENQPLNTSLNIFGEEIRDNPGPAMSIKETANAKRKRLGIRGNAKRKEL